MAAVHIRALTTAPRIKPTSILLRSARRPNPGRGSTYRRGNFVQTTGTSSDVFKHASLNNMSEAHVMTKDLDFFPLFEALRDTPVSVHLHCQTNQTSEELMSLADVVIPITPFTILRWLRYP